MLPPLSWPLASECFFLKQHRTFSASRQAHSRGLTADVLVLGFRPYLPIFPSAICSVLFDCHCCPWLNTASFSLPSPLVRATPTRSVTRSPMPSSTLVSLRTPSPRYASIRHVSSLVPQLTLCFRRSLVRPPPKLV